MKASRSLVVLFSLLQVLLMACLAVYGTSAGVESAEDDTHGFNSKAKFARDNAMPNELEATEEGRRLLMNGCAKCGGGKCCPKGWYCKYGKCVKPY
ncbi:hypothetical protein CBR_g56043 [Chara braunii]|uniref:Uncharacterized protein n=1 Tax=Chara braunii TaxID=69332 RepID=A0A388MDD1_CHABU|nr:hypothetical protein CBR_g56043 [Chara braunii]|eukprot:GBG92570.1 hypothetical protein CBR_g56043 [Chara braunii]